jgi:hypothetical protein
LVCDFSILAFNLAWGLQGFHLHLQIDPTGTIVDVIEISVSFTFSLSSSSGFLWIIVSSSPEGFVPLTLIPKFLIADA